MPQPTRPASVRIIQYWPLRQRLLMPMAQPLANGIGREMERGSGSLMAGLPGVPWGDGVVSTPRSTAPGDDTQRLYRDGRRSWRLRSWLRSERVIMYIDLASKLHKSSSGSVPCNQLELTEIMERDEITPRLEARGLVEQQGMGLR